MREAKDEVKRIKRRMLSLARHLLDLEERAQEIYRMTGDPNPICWGKPADRILELERGRRYEDRRLENHRRTMQEIADQVRDDGQDPESIYGNWEWVGGRPTGRLDRGDGRGYSVP